VKAISFLSAAAIIALPLASQTAASPDSNRRTQLFRHHGTVAWSCGPADVKAFVYESGLAVDADGAFRAYHPNNRLGLDSIEHAGRPGNWWALATDTGKPSGHPVLQGKDDPAPGYYVSMTSLFDSNIPNERNPRRFVDAGSIPYVVLPPKGFKHAQLGDFAIVINLRNGKMSGAIVADESAPDLPIGEGSIALANALGIDTNPRTGGVEDAVAYVIYPGSGNGRPRQRHEIDSVARRYFERWGTMAKLRNCLPK
jgi:hypothetical protein